jgi:hypothetical protein
MPLTPLMSVQDGPRSTIDGKATMSNTHTTADNRYHISLSEDSWIIRFYIWLYEATPGDINTCKLFWAYVFAPLVLPFALVLRFLALVFGPLAEIIGQRLDDRRRRQPESAPPEPRQKSRAERFLIKTGEVLGVIWFKLQKPLQYLMLTLGIGIAVACLALFIYTLVTNPYDVFIGFLTVLAIVVAIAIAVGIITLFAATPVGTKAAAPFRTFWRVMRIAGHAVHDHTCAIVDVRQE